MPRGQRADVMQAQFGNGLCIAVAVNGPCKYEPTPVRGSHSNDSRRREWRHRARVLTPLASGAQARHSTEDGTIREEGG